MGRVWRSSAGWLLSGYTLLLVLLAVYARILGAVLGAETPLRVQPVEMLITVGLAWFVWRRSRLAWRVLVALDVWTSFVLVVHSDVTAYNFPPFLVFGAQVAILLAPAVRTHVARPVVPTPPPAPDAA